MDERSPGRTFTVEPDDDGIRLDRWFKRHQADVSFNTVSRWARTGQLRLDGMRATPGDRIEAGQQIRIPPIEAQPAQGPRRQPRRDPVTADEAEFVRSLVIEHTPHAFVLNKPPGLATQGGTKTSNHLDRLLGGLDEDEANRPKLVHRLDKDTSGVLLVARSARAAAFFSKSFSSRTAKKVYWALVVGVPPGEEGEIDLPLAKQPGTGGEKMHIDPENGLAAKTRWRMIDRAGNRTAWLELQPLTGRTHQLRAHLAATGFPIVGDGKYGGIDAQLTGGISRKLHLHARRLKIDAPDNQVIDVTADLPDHFEQSLEMLGFSRISGDMLPLERASPSSTPQAKERRAAAAAKSRRRERRGERRARGSQPKPKRR